MLQWQHKTDCYPQLIFGQRMFSPQDDPQDNWLDDGNQSNSNSNTTIEQQQSVIHLNNSIDKTVKPKTTTINIPATIQSCSMIRQCIAMIADAFHNRQPNTTFSILCDSILVTGDNEESIQRCQDMIRTQLLDKLRYIKFKYALDRDVFIYTESPRRKAILENNKCSLLKLNGQLYLSSFCKTVDELEVVKQKITIEGTYSVAWRNYKHVSFVYDHVAQYMLKYLQNNAPFLESRKVQVEMNINSSHFYISGETGQGRRQVKDKLITLINSVLVAQIKTNSNLGAFKSMSSYLAKVTDHPVVFKKIEEGVYILVTKDSIFRQLLQKQRFVNFLNVNHNNKIGLHLLEFNRHGDKYEGLKAFIAQHQYYMEEKGPFEYFVEFMKKTGSESNPSVYLDFIAKVVRHLIQTKIKPVPFVRRQQPGHEKPKTLPSDVFLQEGEVVPYKETVQLVQQFGCDVRMTRIYLNSKHLKEYDLFNGEQAVKQLFTKVDWCRPGQTQIIPICRQKMGQSSYFYGKVKSNSIVSKFLPEYIIDVV